MSLQAMMALALLRVFYYFILLLLISKFQQ